MSEAKPSEHYDRFYSKGGFKYSAWREKRFLRKRIVRPLKLKKGSKLLELGCGMGFHSNLLSELGFEVTGVDYSEVGVARAKQRFPTPRFFHLDARDLSSEFEAERFDVIFVRGMSWYHYELGGINKDGVDVRARTREFFRFLKKGGIFVLQVITDFSGRRPDNEVHNNRLEDYVKLFEPCGKIIFISDWKGNVIETERDAEKARRGIIIATQK